MDRWTPSGAPFYPPTPAAEFELISIADIEPPTRAPGVPFFKKYKL
ncbi:MAG: hypothetical protein ABSF11_10885 [Methylocella sp.]|jgi:hypothetical protein